MKRFVICGMGIVGIDCGRLFAHGQYVLNDISDQSLCSLYLKYVSMSITKLRW